ncbi:organic hydroperoxide resistance protein [Gluconacetobacter tumulisoli]|uniref:Organic hydroperoxide resistance protein n=1 Tax=Gluconacetobacter tumulisoli TaxID=1286189 RepID=A0A7W4K5K1_9PROT|nr:organic hydroperoxide resistance protein [Gluconacetobacter tumulisoli]MBB2200818.1 organic hydroperoxide resistance protein [Gluconacetobacter tumulisoli]
MNSQMKTVLYTGHIHATGGRDGAARSDDGHLDIRLSPPGSGGQGTNPEQLFAAGWSACFIGAIRLAARAQAVALPADVSVEAEIDLTKDDSGFALQARLTVNLPDLDAHIARAIVDAAHQTCPYSKATRGNIDVAIEIA